VAGSPYWSCLGVSYSRPRVTNSQGAGASHQVDREGFEQNGVVRDPIKGDIVYYVIAQSWSDADGKYFQGTYPQCLVSNEGNEVSTQRHRVALTAIDWSAGGQDMHTALEVHCLD
jgi:hypothetical protein